MGRNEEQNQAKREAQRAKILAVSLQLFVKRGFAATRIVDIAEAAAIAQGLLYRYFAAKDDILVALLEAALPRLVAATKALAALPKPAGEKITMALQALVRGLDENDETGRYHLLIAMAAASDAIPARARAILDEHSRTPYLVLRRLFAQGQKEGAIRAGDPKEQALLFWALIKGLAIHHAIHGHALGRPTAKAILPLFFRKEVPCPA